MLVEVLSVSFRESLVCSIDLTSFRGMESTMVVESSPLVKNIISLLKIILRFCQCLCEYSYQKQALATTFRFHSIKKYETHGQQTEALTHSTPANRAQLRILCPLAQEEPSVYLPTHPHHARYCFGSFLRPIQPKTLLPSLKWFLSVNF